MILESSYWKNHLAKQARFIDSKQSQTRWSEASLARLEREVMIGFYTIRKLAEAQKIKNSVFEQPVNLLCYQANGKSVGHLNWRKIDDLYNVKNATTISKPLSFIVNQIIHSFVFLPIFKESKNGIELLAFNSDRSKASILYAINISTVAKLFAEVSNSYLTTLTYFRITPDGDLVLAPEQP